MVDLTTLYTEIFVSDPALLKFSLKAGIDLAVCLFAAFFLFAVPSSQNLKSSQLLFALTKKTLKSEHVFSSFVLRLDEMLRNDQR